MITLKKITIEGYKSIAKAEVELRDLNVIVGANGSGKSNFIGAFKLLERIVTKRLQETVGSEPDRLLFHGRKTTKLLHVRCSFDANSYEIKLVSNNDTLVFESENIGYSNSYYYWGHSESMASGHKESPLSDYALKYKNQIPKYVYPLVKGMIVYHFHDTSETSAIKSVSDIDNNRYLARDASNIAAYLYYLNNSKPHDFSKIVDCIRLVAPYFDGFNLEPLRSNPNKIKLTWRQRGSDAYFDAYSLSDGTLRFICLATLLMQPEPPALILLDEPELGLHPYAIALLAEMLESAAVKSQVIIATQSVTLLNWMKPENVIVAEHDGLATNFSRPAIETLKPWLEDFSMGDIWEKNLIGGRP